MSAPADPRSLNRRRPSARTQDGNRLRPANLAGTREGVMKNWLTVAEAAEYSGVSRDTIYTPANVASSVTRASVDDDLSG